MNYNLDSAFMKIQNLIDEKSMLEKQNPKNYSRSATLEAAELQELFRWVSENENIKRYDKA